MGIFKNVEMLAEMVQEADEPVLESLTDITVTFSEKDPMGFTLHFHFAPNQFFTNSVLTKCYEMKCEPPEDDPFSFEGPEIFNFFDPPAVPDDPNAKVGEDTQALLTADFEIGHYIRERIVPRAVLFFTGEALEDESDVEEEESDDEDDDDSDNDADFDPSKAQANPECKQQ